MNNKIKFHFLLFFTGFFPVIFLSCSQNSKGSIEKSFENFISENFVKLEQYDGINSIEITDSIDFLMTLRNLQHTLDSVRNGRDIIEKEVIYRLSKSPNSFFWKYRDHKYIVDNQEDLLNRRILSIMGFEKEVNLFLTKIDTTSSKSKSYKLNIRLKDREETIPYYGMTLPFSDSIIFSPNKIQIDDIPYPLNQVYSFINNYHTEIEYELESWKELLILKEDLDKEGIK